MIYPKNIDNRKIDFTNDLLTKNIYPLYKELDYMAWDDPNREEKFYNIRAIWLFYIELYHTALKLLNLQELAYIRDTRIGNSVRFPEHKPKEIEDDYYIKNAFTPTSYAPLSCEIENDFKDLSDEEKKEWSLKYKSQFQVNMERLLAEKKVDREGKNVDRKI